MSIQAMVRVMSDSDAEGMARLVLIVMANRAGGDDDLCFASVERLASEARLGTRTVQRSIAKLVEAGDLEFAGIHEQYRTNIHRVMPIDRGVSESHPPVEPGHVLTPNRKKQGSELGSVGSSSSVSNTAQAANAASSEDPFSAEDWHYLLDKLHRQGWTETGRGALTWRFLMRLRLKYGSTVVDSALRDCTYNDSAPEMSAAAYFASVCERFSAAVVA